MRFREQRRGHHNAEIEHCSAECRVSESPQRIEQPGDAARQAEEDHHGRNDSQRAGQDLLQRRVLEIAKQPGERPGEQLQPQHDHAHCQRNQAENGARHTGQLISSVGARVFAEDRHQRRAQHAAYQEIVDHGRHARGQPERA